MVTARQQTIVRQPSNPGDEFTDAVEIEEYNMGQPRFEVSNGTVLKGEMQQNGNLDEPK